MTVPMSGRRHDFLSPSSQMLSEAVSRSSPRDFAAPEIFELDREQVTTKVHAPTRFPPRAGASSPRAAPESVQQGGFRVQRRHTDGVPRATTGRAGRRGLNRRRGRDRLGRQLRQHQAAILGEGGFKRIGERGDQWPSRQMSMAEDPMTDIRIVQERWRPVRLCEHLVTSRLKPMTV